VSDTPRTDKQVAKHRLLGGGPLELNGPFADFARELERENAALREAGHLAEKIIVQRTDEIRHLEGENAALRAVYQAAKLLTDYDHEGAEMGWPDWDDRFGWLKSAIGAARKTTAT
jgi:hypothetical protein